ncbi:unnamed protein product [Adineta ricciae]|uniref:Uncharacterized protein n=1 Tax=Adineta ricciae TaxID=249248 RepID=A0A814ZVS6_ADIRI|nr:unnamed protein product [Adineta ricciae]CAF1246946.1 unnamed protein product [Adineta ricciae]
MLMKFTAFFALFGIAVAHFSFEWDKFKHDYNKQYATVEEETERKEIFIENVKQMYSYREMHPKATFTMAINHLFDRRIEEIVPARKIRKEFHKIPIQSSGRKMDFPESLDWRTRNVTTKINDYLGTIITAVVSTEVVESLHAIETGELIQGSVEQVYDCCPQPIDAFDCIMNMSGICRKTDYPEPLNKCEPNKCQPFASFNTIKRMKTPDENQMLAWLQESTLWAEMNTGGKGFRSYSGGIYDEPSCSGAVDYVVQIIGYGTEAGKPYWLGEKWGQKGYFQIVRGKNMCGIANVVIQVANTKTTDATTKSTDPTTTKSDGTLQNTLIPIYFIFLSTAISRKIVTYC